MILIADSESSQNFASIGSSMTCCRLFGVFCVEESHFSQKQDFPVGEQINTLWGQPTPPSTNSGRKIPTMNRSNGFF